MSPSRHRAENVRYLEEKELCGWKKVCVCVVSDGRRKANPGTLQWATEHGLFDKGGDEDKQGHRETDEYRCFRSRPGSLQRQSVMDQDDGFRDIFP